MPYRAILLSSLCLCGSASALDAELNKPYPLHIVLHFADHPQFTEAYRKRVERDLGDAVQSALGDLGRVTMLRDHPKLRDVLQNGLQATLDGWKERSGIKTHFVLVRYTGTEFEMETRQHDGVSGQASLFTGQVVRRERTRERDMVARLATLMVARDFGLIGTPIGSGDAPDLVKIVLKGGGLGVPLGPWVKKDELFGLVGIPKDGPGDTVFPWLFLRVEQPPAENARDGVCLCRLYFRHVNPLGDPNFAGFRCVKLGTTRGPVRLRMNQRTSQSVGPVTEPLTIFVRRHGFDGETETRLRDDTRPDGTVDTAHFGEKGVFEHLAFVSVHGSRAGAARVPKLPVPILTDEPLDVSVPAAAEGDGLFRFQRDEWTRKVTDSYLVQASLFKRLNEMTANPQLRKDALAEAQAGLERSRSDYTRLTAERKELEQEIQKQPSAQKPNLTAWDDRLKKMRDAESELVGYIKTIESIQGVENDPERQKWLLEIESAKLLEKKYEYGQAIEIYENARKIKSLDSAELRQRIERLRKVWETKGDKPFAAARSFIYNVWPKLDTRGLKAHLDETKQAFAECKRVGDPLGPQKLMEAMLVHRQRIENELKQLKPHLNVDDEPKTKLIGELTAELGKLETEIEVYLKASK